MRSSFDKNLYSLTCKAVGSMLRERKAQRDYSNPTATLASWPSPVGRAMLPGNYHRAKKGGPSAMAQPAVKRLAQVDA